MEQQYIRERERQEKLSRRGGAVFTIIVHTALFVCFLHTGFTYLDPPPPEKELILIEFDEPEIERPRQTWNGSRPQAVNPDRSKPINLVQRSEAQHEGTKSNEAPEATVDDFGDVDIVEPKREKEIDRRALFHAADNKTDKDTLAQQTADKVTDALKAGHAQGNTKTGETSGEPKAQLAGRTHNGSLPRPSAPGQQVGKVVVDIWVDNYGMVQKAVAGAEGTTVTDKDLWNEARKAAMKASFNMSADAPAMQKGTITYIFKVK